MRLTKRSAEIVTTAVTIAVRNAIVSIPTATVLHIGMGALSRKVTLKVYRVL